MLGTGTLQIDTLRTGTLKTNATDQTGTLIVYKKDHPVEMGAIRSNLCLGSDIVSGRGAVAKPLRLANWPGTGAVESVHHRRRTPSGPCSVGSYNGL